MTHTLPSLLVRRCARVMCSFLRSFLIAITFLISVISPLQAQNTTEGTEFWVTFGQIANIVMNPIYVNVFEFNIRIVGGSVPTSGTIYFTNLDKFVPFYIAPYEIYEYPLDNIEKFAVYNSESEVVTNFSIRITTSNPVSAFAFMRCSSWSDATNILPVTALGTEYYAISYPPSVALYDAFTVIATRNNTLLWHNNTSVPLDSGEVYYRKSNDITGDHITSNKPVAFFAQSRATIVQNTTGNSLFQQLAPVLTWGKTFFVPVTVIGTEYVRILASQNSTNISQTGGTIVIGTGGQTTLTNLQAGQFVELEISLSNNGCYISANKPVGVCSFMESTGNTNPFGSASQVWIPAIEQTTPNVLMAPFAQSAINYHNALVITPSISKDETKVSIGGALPISLSSDTWYDNAAAQMSFCDFPLTNLSASYVFSNPAGIIVLGYGIHGVFGTPASYYYLAGSSMRNLSAAFTANNIPYTELHNNPFCEHDITFIANIEGINPNPGSLKWYINGVEEVTKRDSLEWKKTFLTGNYVIKMSVLFEDNTTKTYEDTLKIKTCEAVFYANGVLCDTLENTTFCEKMVYFQADVEGLHPDPGRIRWYIDGIEETAALDKPTWNKSFETGEYDIEMVVRYANGETATIFGRLKVRIFWTKIRNLRN